MDIGREQSHIVVPHRVAGYGFEGIERKNNKKKTYPYPFPKGREFLPFGNTEDGLNHHNAKSQRRGI
jgi:hypothetical protein